MSLLQRGIHPAPLTPPLPGAAVVRTLGVLAAFCLGTVGCAPSAADLAAAQQQLLQRDQAWSALAAAGQDVEKTAAFWADDAVIIPPGRPVIEGKQAIRAFVAGAFRTPGFHIRWKSQTAVLSPDGKFAYLRGTNSITVADANGVPVATSARAMTVWRREADGQWRCVLDMWNAAPVAAAAPAATAP
jgi:uncharacterized protein (TIGR02246 family)